MRKALKRILDRFRGAASIRSFRRQRRLRAALESRLAQLEQQIADDRQVSQEDVVTLATLRQLAGSPSRPLRWFWLVPLGLCLGVASLAMSPVSKTRVALDARLTGVAFQLREAQVLGPPLAVEDLGFAGFAEATVPGGPGEEKRKFGGDGTPQRLQISQANPAARLSLAGLSLPAGTRVRLQAASRSSKSYRMTIRSPEEHELRANGQGPLRIVAPLIPFQDDLSPTMPRPFRIRARPEKSLDVTWTLSKPDLRTFAQHLRIRDLELLQPSESLEVGGNPVERDVSTVRSGTLHYESLPSESRDLRWGEILRFGASVGEISYLGFNSEGSWELRFEGEVRDMHSGLSQASLMPLQWQIWNAKSSVAVFWTALIGFITLLDSLRNLGALS